MREDERVNRLIRNTDWKIESDSKLIEPFKKDKKKRIQEYRREASRLASMANKRLQRLEGNKLTDSPAYQSLVGDYGTKPRFSVRGKSYNELQKEVARMNRFLNAKTSTVRGANKILKEMAENTGIKYKNLTQLKEKAKQFFELASKVEQYLRTVDDMASAVAYQKIWVAVNKYVKEFKSVIDDVELDIEQMTEKISDAIKEHQQKELIQSLNDPRVRGWYQLDKNE